MKEDISSSDRNISPLGFLHEAEPIIDLMMLSVKHISRDPEELASALFHLFICTHNDPYQPFWRACFRKVILKEGLGEEGTKSGTRRLPRPYPIRLMRKILS
jgi:hypothetical protein